MPAGCGLADAFGDAFGDADDAGTGDPDAIGDGTAIGDPLPTGAGEGAPVTTAGGTGEGGVTCATTMRDVRCSSDLVPGDDDAAGTAVPEAAGDGDGDPRISESAKPPTVGNGIDASAGVRKTAPSTARSRLVTAAWPGPAGC